MMFIQTFFTFRARPQFFFFFFIKASQSTQVDRKQMEHRYLVYSEKFVVFLMYIPVFSEKVRELTKTTRPLTRPYGQEREPGNEFVNQRLLLSIRLHPISLRKKSPFSPLLLFVLLLFFTLQFVLSLSFYIAMLIFVCLFCQASE